MIKSMTGYGKAEVLLKTGKLTVEIRSLNGKTADISIKTSLLPKDKEIEVRKLIAAEMNRGNIDFFITYEPNQTEAAKRINGEVLKSYCSQLAEIVPELSSNFQNVWERSEVADMLLLQAVLRMPDIVDTQKADVITDENWPLVEHAVRQALEHINEFRSREGEVLYRDVTAKVHSILSSVDEVEKYEKERTDLVREKILARFEELKLEPDQSRLEAEMIFYLEKLDINEEKVRLRQHCRYFLDTIDNEQFPGKKLGFIAQEMGREINTTGSKANNTEIQKIVVRMKDDLEKIKEQSLNIL